MRFQALIVASIFCAPISAAHAADVPGSKDPPGFKRFEGSEIIHYATSGYEPYFLARGEGSIGVGFEKEERVEGATIHVVYKGPAGTSALEVFRNYEQLLSDLGFEETFKLDTGSFGYLSSPDFYKRVYFQSGYLARKAHEDSPYQDSKNQYYASGKKTVDGQTVSVAVLAVEGAEMSWREPSVKQPIAIKADQAVIGVDVITGKQINYRMVEVKADDMAKALASDGKLDLYGILFDIDKTDLKPESKTTLDEVAKLLKADPALKLEVAGHTDNTGNAEHNMKLSAGRAAAVVNALVTNYGIDKARLQPNGYGDTKPVAPNDTDQNRAKNRRVELKKI
jgi:outer membrane protein OmpA-like peptidoglycan-associated protein